MRETNQEVKRAKKRAKLTNEDIALRSEVSLPYVNLIVRGNVQPRYKSALKIAEALNTTVEALYPNTILKGA